MHEDLSRWTLAGVALACAVYLAGIFAATYSLIAWAWERFARP